MSGETKKKTTKKVAPYQIQNKDLEKELKRAEKAGKYFVTVSRSNGDVITHTTFTEHFNKADLLPSLEEIAKLATLEAKE